MQNMPDFTQIMRLAKSPEGQKLIAMLQNTDSAAINSAVKRAQTGDYDGARSALSSLLERPEILQLLKQLEG